MKKNYDVVLRGHHVEDPHTFLLDGGSAHIKRLEYWNYGENFINNHIEVMKKITSSNIRVKLVDAFDDICRACDEESRKRHCGSAADMALLDKSYARSYYGFKIGKIYTSKQILKQINKKVRKTRRVKINF